jgi:uncharacterized membrane protein
MILKRILGITAILAMALLYFSCKHETVIPEQKVCFTADVQPIINANCANTGCHDAITHEEGIDLSSYNGIMKEVSAGKPYDSELYDIIRSGEMPPSPRTALNSDQMKLIYVWILQGAKNEACAK